MLRFSIQVFRRVVYIRSYLLVNQKCQNRVSADNIAHQHLNFQIQRKKAMCAEQHLRSHCMSNSSGILESCFIWLPRLYKFCCFIMIPLRKAFRPSNKVSLKMLSIGAKTIKKKKGWKKGLKKDKPMSLQRLETLNWTALNSLQPGQSMPCRSHPLECNLILVFWALMGFS